MNERWTRRIQGRAWAPRALAVFSCALALLAAQPVLAAHAPAARQVPLVAPERAAAAEGILPTKRESGEAQFHSARRDTNFFNSARRLHILATVEIIKRLLLSELQPVQQQMIPALVLEPLACIERLPVDLTCPTCEAPPPYAPLPPPELRFVRQHAQLAPPIV